YRRRLWPNEARAEPSRCLSPPIRRSTHKHPQTIVLRVHQLLEQAATDLQPRSRSGRAIPQTVFSRHLRRGFRWNSINVISPRSVERTSSSADLDKRLHLGERFQKALREVQPSNSERVLSLTTGCADRNQRGLRACWPSQRE